MQAIGVDPQNRVKRARQLLGPHIWVLASPDQKLHVVAANFEILGKFRTKNDQGADVFFRAFLVIFGGQNDQMSKNGHFWPFFGGYWSDPPEKSSGKGSFFRVLEDFRQKSTLKRVDFCRFKNMLLSTGLGKWSFLWSIVDRQRNPGPCRFLPSVKNRSENNT